MFSLCYRKLVRVRILKVKGRVGGKGIRAPDGKVVTWRSSDTCCVPWKNSTGSKTSNKRHGYFPIRVTTLSLGTRHQNQLPASLQGEVSQLGLGIQRDEVW